MTINYNSTSSQIGITKKDNFVFINFNNQIPDYYQSRISCSINESIVETTKINQNIFKCKINVQQDDIYSIGMKFLKPNLFSISGLIGLFQEKYVININGGILNKLDVVTVKLNTQNLINQKLLKNDCSDLIITFNDQKIGHELQNCNAIETIIFIKIEQSFTGSSQNYSIYFGNEFQNATSITTSGNNKLITYSLQKSNNTLLALSSNELTYRAVPLIRIDDVTPKLDLIEIRNISLTSNIEIKDYGLLDYVISDGKFDYNARMISNKFESYLSSNISQKLNISIYAVYKVTKEKLLISSISSFYFFINLNLKDITPFVDKFNETTKKQTKIITIRSNENIFSDFELYCKFYHNSTVSYSKSTKISSNSINCELSVDLSLNTELIRIGLSVNQTISNMIDLHLKNSTYVFIKEPITFTGLQKTIIPKDYNKNVTLNFNDVRNTEFVSFQNYSFVMKPELHSEISINCIYDSIVSCSIPNFNFNYIPVKLISNLKVYSQFHSNPFSIEIDTLYHKGNVFIHSFLTINP